MSYEKSMYLLSLLYSAASDEKREKLGELFQSTVKMTEGFQKLTRLMQVTTFLGHDGASQKEEVTNLLKAALSQIQNGPDNIKKMDILLQHIEREVSDAERLIQSPRFFDDELIAISSEQYGEYSKFYRELASSICYYMVSQFGVKAIRNLTFNQRAGFSELVHLVNQQYATELTMSAELPKPYAWSINKAHFSGDNLISYDGYTVEYSQMKLSEMLRKVELGEYKQIAPFCFAATSSAIQTPLIGIGNVVGVEPQYALQLLDAEIVTSMSPESFTFARGCFDDILTSIAEAVQTDKYCIAPEDIVRALNRYYLNITVATRKQQGKCIICGQTMRNNKYACSSHFTINQ